MTPEQAKEEALKCAKDYQEVFGGPHGKRVLADLAKQCFENDLTFVPGESDKSAFNEGRRFVMLYIRGLLNVQL